MIPISEPWLTNRETELVSDAIASGWISGSGEYIERFERDWASLCSRTYGVAVSNGTAALETAVHALDLPPGSEVIIPTFTLISCLTAVLRSSLVPVLVDADPRTWCISVDEVEACISERTRAIMAVHIYGHPVDMDPLLALAQKYDLKIIEDAAEAQGAHYHGRICGSFGDVSTFSFYANKIVTTGEGGMVVCDGADIAERCRAYRNLYFGQNQRFLHSELGCNFRFTNLQAALGCAQLERFSEAVARKTRIAQSYNELLSDVEDLQLPALSNDVENVFWVYGVVLGRRYPFDAAELIRRLRDSGVESRPFFLGLHEQPPVRDLGIASGLRFPVAECLARRGLYLPSGLVITSQQIRKVADTLKQCLAR